MKHLLEEELNKQDRECIYKDVPRTLPEHEMFAEKDGPGQKALYGVLKCMAITFTETGYV